MDGIGFEPYINFLQKFNRVNLWPLQLARQNLGKWACVDLNHRPYGCEPYALTN